MVIYGDDILLSASRWPLIKHILSILTKLSPVVYEEGESGTANVAVFTDEGAGEVLRWLGGLPYIQHEINKRGLGIGSKLYCPCRLLGPFSISDDFCRPSEGKTTKGTPVVPPLAHGSKAGLFLISGFACDAEAFILSVARQLSLRVISVATDITEDAHVLHPYAETMFGDTMGVPSFSSIARGVKESLELWSSVEVVVEVNYIMLHVLPIMPSELGGGFTLAIPPLFSSGLRPGLKLDIFPLLPWQHRTPQVDSSYKLLAHQLTGAISQLGLDVNERVFAVGETSLLVGSALGPLLTSKSTDSPNKKKSSIILIDRTVDLFTACCHGGGVAPLLQRIFTSLPCASHVSPEVGVDIPALWPGLGPFSKASGDLSPSFAAGKAAASFTWPVPPALCHPQCGEINSNASNLLGILVTGTEDMGRNAILEALMEASKLEGCPQPSSRKRGWGAEIYAWLMALSKGPYGKRALARHAHLVQMALAVTEALYRTSSHGPNSDWELIAGLERAQIQTVRDGACWSDLAEQVVDASSRLPLGICLLFTIRIATALHTRPDSNSKELILSALEMSSARGIRRTIGAEQGNRQLTSSQEIFQADAYLDRVLAVSFSGSAALLRTQALLTLVTDKFMFPSGTNANTHEERGQIDSQIPDAYTQSDGWDDWGENDNVAEQESVPSSSAPVECLTVLGRLAALFLEEKQTTNNLPSILPELIQPRSVNVTSVGLGLLSAGLSKLTGGAGGMSAVDIGSRLHQRRHCPRDSDVVVLFVVGGFTPQEVQELHVIAERSSAGSPRLLLGGTGICKPSNIYNKVFDGLE